MKSCACAVRQHTPYVGMTVYTYACLYDVCMTYQYYPSHAGNLWKLCAVILPAKSLLIGVLARASAFRNE